MVALDAAERPSQHSRVRHDFSPVTRVVTRRLDPRAYTFIRQDGHESISGLSLDMQCGQRAPKLLEEERDDALADELS